MNKEITFEATGPIIDSMTFVSEIVKSDYRTAPVFKKYNINYCCAGKTPLRDICDSMGVSTDNIIQDLKEVTRNLSLHPGIKFDDWKTAFLIEYIVNIHHAYLYNCLPEIHAGLLSFMDQHIKKYPELEQIFATFTKLSELLISHNHNEEEVIFPYIRRLDSTFSKEESYAQLFVKTLRKPLTTLQDEHLEIARLLRQIQTLTNNYTFPANACTNHRVIYGKLHEFHDDLVQHKHLEDDILFPRAVEIERVLLSN